MMVEIYVIGLWVVCGVYAGERARVYTGEGVRGGIRGGIGLWGVHHMRY